MPDGRVEALYCLLKEMAVNFKLKPGEKINEATLAKDLAASRTPLREALNRLVAERFFEFKSGKGFYCRELSATAVFELYETREILESAAVRLACARGSDLDIDNLKTMLENNGLDYEGKTVGETAALDEGFHLGIARLSENNELVRQIKHMNERIRFIRWIDLSTRGLKTKGAHTAILEAIQARDVDRAAELMRSHISVRMERVVAIVKEGYSNIYVEGVEGLQNQRISAHGEP